MSRWRMAAALVACGLVGCTGPGGKTAPPVASSAAPLKQVQPLALPSASASAPEPVASAPPAEVRRPMNVLLITIDALRADVPDRVADHEVHPNLTRLASQSTVFTHAYSLSSVTSKSLGGFLAGKYPSELARSAYFFPIYAPENLMFPEVLQQAGVKTLAVHAHWSLAKELGYGQGFDVWKMVPGLMSGPAADKQTTGDQHTKIFLDLLASELKPGVKFFAWAHLTEPHQDYLSHPGAPNFGYADRERYYGEVWFADQLLAKILEYADAQPWAKDTVVMVSADHGEAFSEHNMGGHAFELWEELVRVPWMVRVPGRAASKIETPRSHIDLAPTVLDFLGVASPAEFHGRSLVGEIYGADAPARTIICDLPEDDRNGRRRAVVDGGYKLTIRGSERNLLLYDLNADPLEKKDLSKENRDETARMLELYRASERDYPRKALPPR